MTFKEVYMTNKKITKSKKQEKRTLEHKHQKSKKISEKDLGKVHGGMMMPWTGVPTGNAKGPKYPVRDL